MGIKVNVNFVRNYKIAHLYKIEVSLFSRNLKIVLQFERRNSVFTRKQKFAVDKLMVSPVTSTFPNFRNPQRVHRRFRVSDIPKERKNVSEFRISLKNTKMFPKFGNP